MLHTAAILCLVGIVGSLLMRLNMNLSDGKLLIQHNNTTSLPNGGWSSGGGGGSSGSSCLTHVWVRLPDSDTVADRIKTLEADSGIGAQYNACLARKFQGQGKQVDVSVRFQCKNCQAYQEIDLIVLKFRTDA